MDDSVAVLGHAHWLDADARDALGRLLAERLTVDVAAIDDLSEITVRMPTPSGAWWRLPAVVHGRRALLVRATPLPGGEGLLDLIDAAPAFDELDRLVGFVRVLGAPSAGCQIAVVARADAVLGRIGAVSGAPARLSPVRACIRSDAHRRPLCRRSADAAAATAMCSAT